MFLDTLLVHGLLAYKTMAINGDSHCKDGRWQNWNLDKGIFIALIKVRFNDKEKTVKGYISSAMVNTFFFTLFNHFLFVLGTNML